MKGDGGSMKTRQDSGFWSLPEDVRDAAEAAACKEFKVSNFYDLDPAVRRDVRETAVREHDAA